jgi:DNA mismatch repair protein MutL
LKGEPPRIAEASQEVPPEEGRRNMPIRILPRELTEKIAAGEVVERPASVVKELVENALDAQAGTVLVRVGLDPVEHLEVVDDGTGMRPDEISLALKRHATSKIAAYEDLYRITSLGFRGEALPSIAAVADLEIETKTEDAPFGIRVQVKEGREGRPHEVGMPKGTRVVVRNLFRTTPARRKFLRSQQTETGHILDTFIRLALSRADVSFQLKRSARIWINAPRTDDLRQRVAQLLGREFGEGLHPVSAGIGGYRVEGLVGPCDLNKVSSRGMFLFVNGRPVRDLQLQRAIRAAYHGRLPKERFPVAVLSFTVPHADVDVNVHPTKAEVHFSHPQKIRDLLLTSLSEVIRRTPWPDEPPPVPTAVRGSELPGTPRGPAPEAHAPTPYGRGVPGIPEPTQGVREGFVPLPRPAAGGETGAKGKADLLFSTFRIIGQFKDTYLLCEYRDRLVLVDQHAAHERIAFEELQEACGTERIARQPLLVPSVVEVAPREAECLRKHIDSLMDCGLEAEFYGGRSFVVKSIPAMLGRIEPAGLLQDVAEELVELERAQQLDLLRTHVLARIACHSVVRAGRSLEWREMEALLKSLDEKPGLLSCPHGRPVMISWSLQEIEKKFRRS